MRATNVVGVVALAIVLLTFVGCTTMELDARGLDKGVSMTNVLGEETNYRVLTNVSGRTQALWIFGLQLADPDVRSILIREAPGADAYVNVTITTRQTFLSWALSTFTGGAITMRTVTVEGTAVEF